MARQAKSAEKQTLRPTFHHASKHSSGCRRWVARSYSRRAVLARGVGDSERFFCSEKIGVPWRMETLLSLALLLTAAMSRYATGTGICPSGMLWKLLGRYRCVLSR
jgi:hypothetical protein